MFNIYSYIFYYLFVLNRKSYRDKTLAPFIGSIGVASIINLNLMLILTSIDIFKIGLSQYSLLIGGLTMFISYITLIPSKKYIKIINKYSQENKKQKTFRTIIIFLFAILSILSIGLVKELFY
jgi:SNF family Na+-dependent transporter